MSKYDNQVVAEPTYYEPASAPAYYEPPVAKDSGVQLSNTYSPPPEGSRLYEAHDDSSAQSIPAGYQSGMSLNDMYSSVLGRAADTSGASYWGNQFGSEIDQNEYQNFLNAAAPELAQQGYTGNMQLQDLYSGVLGRQADTAGQQYWSGQFGSSIDPTEYQKFVAASRPEITGSIDDMYRNLFGRESETAGMNYWTSQIPQVRTMGGLQQAMASGAQGYDLMAYNDPTMPAIGIERYNKAWNPAYDINKGTYKFDPTKDQWLPQQVVKPPIVNAPPIVNWDGSAQNPSHPIPIFNTDPNASPFSGSRWRDTIKSGTGLTGQAAYDFIKQKASTGQFTLSGLQRELGLNPGEIMAIYEEALNFAGENSLPTILLPAVAEADKPFYNYGFKPGQAMYQRTINGQSVVNPIAAYLAQIYANRGGDSGSSDAVRPPPTVGPGTPPEGTIVVGGSYAKGGKIHGGLGAVQADPVIHRYIRGVPGGGQEDNVHIKASPGEYVFDADAVAALGDGNSDEGARRLDQMRENIRAHKRAAPAKSIPPKAKQPEQYLKGK